MSDKNDYPLPTARRVVRSLLFRSGLTKRLGETWWRETDEAPWIAIRNRHIVSMFEDIPVGFDDPHYAGLIGEGSAYWSDYPEYRIEARDVLVEPNRCLIIGPDGRLLRQSRRARYLPLYPNAFEHRFHHGETRLDEAVVYDGKQSVNYYHHVVDGLTNLAYFLERSGLDRNLPLIVNRWIFDSPFFAYLRGASAEFANLNWRVQEPGEWLRIGKSHLMHAAPFDRTHWTRLLRFYSALSTPRGRRVFLSRDRARFGRGLTNEESVFSMLKTHGFERVYAEHLSIAQQQRLFEETEVLVALHGMGMIQQMFMDARQGRVLEILPQDRIQAEYYWQAWTLGMSRYDVILGSARDSRDEYSVDVDALEAKVLKLLA